VKQASSLREMKPVTPGDKKKRLTADSSIQYLARGGALHTFSRYEGE